MGGPGIRRGLAAARRPGLLALLGVLALALALRTWGAGFGLPYKYHIDEPYYVVGALKLAQGDFHLTVPHNTPNLWQFLLLAEYAALFALGRLAGWYQGTADFAAQYVRDPSAFYLLARWTSALCATATVIPVYWMARWLADRAAGLVAALYLAVCFLAVREGHFAVNDAFIALLTTVTCALALWHLRSRSWPALWLACALCGAATGMKYRPVTFVLPILVAAILAARADGSVRELSSPRRWGPALLAGTAGFLIGFPGVVVNTETFLYHLRAAAAQAGVSYEGWIVDVSPAPLYFLRTAILALGWPMALLAVLGVALCLGWRRAEHWVLLSALAAYLLAIGAVKTYFARYLLPAIPLLVVFAAVATTWLAARLSRRRMDLAGPVTAAVVIVAVAAPLAASARLGYLLTRTDTRTLAKAWIEENIPAGARVITEWPIHGPPLSTTADPEPNSARVYDVLVVGGKGAADHSLTHYREQGYDYLITTSFIDNIALADPGKDMARRAFYAGLPELLDLVAEFRPYGAEAPPFEFDEIYGPYSGLERLQRPGPVLRVYRLGDG